MSYCREKISTIWMLDIKKNSFNFYLNGNYMNVTPLYNSIPPYYI